MFNALRHCPEPGRYVMYGAEFSYYSAKLRSYLRRKGLPYAERRATIRAYHRLIVRRTGVRYIPVLLTPDNEVWQETSDIIDKLEARHPEPALLPAAPLARIVAMLLELIGDEWLLIIALYRRWRDYPQQRNFIDGEFGGMLLPWAPGFVQRRIGRRIGARFSGFLPTLGITPETTAAVDAWYGELLQQLERHFTAHDFLLGARPSIGDCGWMGPFYAHLYRDPVSGAELRARAPAVASWIERAMSANHTVMASGDWPAVLPGALPAILQRIAGEFGPVLAANETALAAWLREQGTGEFIEVPRRLGTHRFTLGGSAAQRAVLPHGLWKWQRVRDAWRALGTDQRSAAAPALAAVEWLTPLEAPATVRLERIHNRVHARLIRP